MSGPFGVDMVVISGQKNSGEVAAAASTFLAMGFLSVTPVSTNLNVRENLLLVLDAFERREGLHFQERPAYFTKQLVKPANNISTGDFFWLALDQEGYSIAKDIFIANGESPDKPVYRSVSKVNLLESIVPPLPDGAISYEFWKEISGKLFNLSLKLRRPSQVEHQSFINAQAPLTPAENEYYCWCKSLYENLLPWRQTIKDIQSDLS